MQQVRLFFGIALLCSATGATQGCYKVTSEDPLKLGIVLVVAALGLTTSEDALSPSHEATFTVVLGNAPTSDVTIPLSSSNTGEGAPTVGSLTFTPANWNVVQTVTVAGIDDINPVIDGPVAYQILLGAATSADFNYSGVGGLSLPFTNLDDDTAGVLVSPSGVGTIETAPMATPSTADITFRLATIPSATVTLTITGLDATEGSLSATTVVFDPGVDSAATILTTGKTITITSVDDLLTDNSQFYTLTATPTSADANYNVPALAVAVDVTNADNDSPGFLVTPTAITTVESPTGANSFTVRLTTQPAGVNVVVIDVTSTLTTEGLLSAAAMGAQTASIPLTFTNADWDVPQPVFVNPVLDQVDDGDQIYTVTLAVNAGSTTEAAYDPLDPDDVTVTNQDTDTAGITVTAATPLITNESGGTATFSVALTTIPVNPVTITFTGVDATEGSLSGPSLLFNNDATALTAQIVTVTGLPDPIPTIDGNVTYVITGTPTSTDPLYDTPTMADFTVTVRNEDNDAPGIEVTATTLTTNESGSSASFQVKLKSIPSDPVTVTFTGLNIDEGILSTTSLLFPAGPAAVAFQTVTVTGKDDVVIDGSVTYTLTGTPTSADLNYNSLTPFTVMVTNDDNDNSPPGSKPTPASGSIVNPSTPSAWDDKKAVEPSVINLAGVYTMWYEGSNAGGQKHEGVGLATSTPLPAGPYGKDPGNPVMTHSGVNGTYDKTGVGDPCVVYEPLKTPPYRMWFGARENAAVKTKIGLATWTGISTDPWIKTASAVVTGTAGTFDATGASSPHVLEDGLGGYKMWYQGVDSSGVGRIGYATSTDGIDWVKPNLNPGDAFRPNVVLDLGTAGALDAASVNMPCVILDGATYRMWYIGLNSTGPTGRQRMFFAQSPDGITWTKLLNPATLQAQAILQPSGTPGAWDEVNLWSPWVIKEGSTYRIWYSGEDGGGLIRIAYTTSP